MKWILNSNINDCFAYNIPLALDEVLKALEHRVEMSKKFLIAICQLFFTLAALIQAQDQPAGFISIDCGLVDEANYKDETTGIHYTSDANVSDTGISGSISSQYKAKSLERQFWNVRSFPEGTRNCYTFNIPLESSNKRLIRTRFMYGNYDGKDSLPRFDLYLGPNWWDTLEFENASSVTTKEIFHLASSDYIHICLVNTKTGTPFISALEIRVLGNDTYKDPPESWQLLERFDAGLQEGQIVRYPDDIYDRIWTPYNPYGWKQISTSLSIDNQDFFSTGVPSIVLRTAATPMNASNNMVFSYKLSDEVATFYVNMYFAEIEKLQANQNREISIYVNGFKIDDPLSLSFLHLLTIGYKTPEPESEIQICLNRTGTATISPFINGIEVYKGKALYTSETDQNDVDAIMQIKSTYCIKQNWQGDPCSPQAYMWKGLKCSNNEQNQTRITSLNLSSSGLTGNIAPGISNLKLIQYLDLSNNSLTGSVPDSLSQLESLKILNIGWNKLSGSIPAKLIERSRNGSLILSIDGNPNLCILRHCHKRKHAVIPLVVGLVGVFILIGVLIFFIFRSRLQVIMSGNKLSFSNKIERVNSRKQEFTYSEVVSITNNFERVVGKGGFGTVYHGWMGERQVAAKMLSSSIQGYQQFQTEAKILTRVHHKCLTPLVGYCNEGTKTALIYEYMTNGDLAEHLSGKSQNFLGWKQRLQIALDSAHGLEYLHNGCEPPIVHRDVKTRNILLNQNFRGKISDFGLSRIFLNESDTHVSTLIAGTPGYLDPEYYITNRLNEKSDVFSFGVVLLEIITGRTAILKTHEKTHIIQWVSSMLADESDIDRIMDPRLKGKYDIEIARKAIEMAMACVGPSSISRPTMNQVVLKLRECLPLENIGNTSTSNELIENVSMESISGQSSLAR